MTKGLLSGVRVLDLSRVLAGPWSTQLLGDLGADVVKIERPGRGDDSRHYGPAFLPAPEGAQRGDSAFFLSANRNKRSVTVDIGRPEGQEIVRQLAAVSDILVENFRTGTLRKYGLDYDTLSAINPKLIYCSITGFGQYGPYARKPGYDGIFQAVGGLMSVTGLPDDVPGGGPMKVGPSIVDVITGYNATAGILAALHHRDTVSGKGQHIDVALLDTVIAAQSHYTAEYLVSRKSPVRKGTEGNGGMPSRVFDCADGVVYLAVGNNEQFVRLCDVLDRQDLARDPRFDTIVGRSDNRRALNPILEDIFRTWKRSELIAALDEAGVPAGAVNTMEDVFADAHVRQRGVEIKATRADGQEVALVANPLRFSETTVDGYEAPPLLGQHTNEVLSDLLGRSEEELRTLRDSGVI